MTTLPAVNAGATTLLDTTPHTDTPPRADTLIQHDDHVIVFLVNKRLIPKVEKLFQVGFGYL